MLVIAKCCLCNSDGVATTGAEIYPHREDLHKKIMYKCPRCPGVYCGSHDATGEPLGIMADAELRALKMKAHELFDPWWKTREMKRWQCYRKLAQELEIEFKECHIGMFSKEMVKKAIVKIAEWK